VNLFAGQAQRIQLDETSWIEYVPCWLPGEEAAALRPSRQRLPVPASASTSPAVCKPQSPVNADWTHIGSV